MLFLATSIPVEGGGALRANPIHRYWCGDVNEIDPIVMSSNQNKVPQDAVLLQRGCTRFPTSQGARMGDAVDVNEDLFRDNWRTR